MFLNVCLSLMDYLSSLCLSVFIKKNTFYWNRFSKPKRRVIEIQVKTSFFLGGVDAGASQKRGEMDHPQRETCSRRSSSTATWIWWKYWNHMILTNLRRFWPLFWPLELFSKQQNNSQGRKRGQKSPSSRIVSSIHFTLVFIRNTLSKLEDFLRSTFILTHLVQSVHIIMATSWKS